MAGMEGFGNLGDGLASYFRVLRRGGEAAMRRINSNTLIPDCISGRSDRGVAHIGAREFNNNALLALGRVTWVLETIRLVRTKVAAQLQGGWYDELCQRAWFEEEGYEGAVEDGFFDERGVGPLRKRVLLSV